MGFIGILETIGGGLEDGRISSMGSPGGTHGFAGLLAEDRTSATSKIGARALTLYILVSTNLLNFHIPQIQPQITLVISGATMRIPHKPVFGTMRRRILSVSSL